MTDKPRLADIHARATRKYLPGMVGYSARLIQRMSVEEVSHGCVRNDPQMMADAVMNAARIQFKDVPAMVQALQDVLALADKWEQGATRWADPLPVPPEVEQVRAAIAAHLDIEGGSERA